MFRLFKRKSSAGKAAVNLSAAQILVIGFFCVILIGGTLLTLPAASSNGISRGPETAYFTAVSATCVTGLAIVDTATGWSLFGHIVILIMIQTGGLGFMTMATMLSLLARRSMSPKERLVAAESLSFSTHANTPSLVKRIFIATGVVEGAGALILMTRFIPMFGLKGIWLGVFHSISAFCNAGFDLMGTYFTPGTSMIGLCSDSVVSSTLMLLIMIGGIGFAVWWDVLDLIFKKKPLSVYSSLVLKFTAALVFGGGALILFFEWSNTATMANMPLWQKIIASLFQSVTTRTAGFMTVDNTLLTESSKALSVLLMFIGGCSGSTAGGIKVNTLAVLLLTVKAYATGRNAVTCKNRSINSSVVMRAMAVTTFALVMNTVATFLLVILDRVPLITALYECVSAGATVGLSLNATPTLSLGSHIITMLLMFAGRVGALTITYSLTLRESRMKNLVTYPEMSMPIG
ncbi:MAG: potassium uptake protein, TrkH family [Clostridiales bacterium]|nr:potassium uptake protein, TrkH family [Clostridiales bacterium]